MKIIVPLNLLIILFLLYSTFNSFRHALLILATVPFASGEVLSLVPTGTAFSISASVGIISTLGVAILGGVLLVSSFTEFQQDSVPLKEATRKGAEQQMRPVLMANLSAAIGLFPATVAIGIGSQAQQPLARVVVGGMLTAAVLKAPTTAPYHATFNLFNFSLPSTKTGYPFSPDGLQRKGIPPRHALLPMN